MTINLADARIIGTLTGTRGLCGHRYTIRQTVHEVQLRDGTLHRLHPVSNGTYPSRSLRALEHDDGRTYTVFDLADIDPRIDTDLCTCAERDVAGLVAFSLRAIYPNTLALRRAISGLTRGSGIPTPVEHRRLQEVAA